MVHSLTWIIFFVFYVSCELMLHPNAASETNAFCGNSFSRFQGWEHNLLGGAKNRVVTSTFFAVLLEAAGDVLAVHRLRLPSHLPVDVELLLQSADDDRQVLLSHLHNKD